MTVTGLVLEGKVIPDCEEAASLRPSIEALMIGARHLKSYRMESGALELESLRIEFELNASKQPIDVAKDDHIEMHDVIAEWMIAANCAVAKRIYDTFPSA